MQPKSATAEIVEWRIAIFLICCDLLLSFDLMSTSRDMNYCYGRMMTMLLFILSHISCVLLRYVAVPVHDFFLDFSFRVSFVDESSTHT